MTTARSADTTPATCGCGRALYRNAGCCEACYRRDRRKKLAYGRARVRVRVDPGPTREHLQRWRDAGLPDRQLGVTAGLSEIVLQRLRKHPTALIDATTESAILAVAIPARVAAVDHVADRANVPITGTRRRLQALVAVGYTQADLARELDISSTKLGTLLEDRPGRQRNQDAVSAGRHRDVRALFARRQMTPGPSQRARDYAAARDWPLPLQWDEDTIDDPAAEPLDVRWTPESALAEEQERRDRNRDDATRLTALGHTAEDIAEQLGVTARTIERWRRTDAMTAASPSYRTITTALDQAAGPGKPSGAWTRYCCPAHPDSTPSLGIKYDAAQQKTIVRCFSGCDDEEVLAAVGLQVRDMFDHLPDPGHTRSPQPKRAPRRAAPKPVERADRGAQTGPRRTVARYTYRSQDDQVVGQVVRTETPHEHGVEKGFYQRRAAGPRQWENAGFAPIPYQLPELLAAVADGSTIYICEGEKDVESAFKAGVTATCNAGGAGSFGAEHARWLNGAASVVVVADRDPAGYRHAAKVRDLLGDTVGDITVGDITVVAAATGKDLTDHLAAGHSLADLQPIDPDNPPGDTPTTTTEETTTMPFLEPRQEQAPQHPSEVDHGAAQFAAFTQVLANFIVMKLEKARTREDSRTTQDVQARQRRHTEMKQAEATLRKQAEAGWDNLTRHGLVTAWKQANEYRDESPHVEATARELDRHVRERFAVDPATGAPTGVTHAQLYTAAVDRRTVGRVEAAHRGIVTTVAATGIDPAAKDRLYHHANEWRLARNKRTAMHTLLQDMTAAGVDEDTRNHVLFTGAYLTGHADAVATLRAMPAQADVGDAAKPRIDSLLALYQQQLARGMDTTSVTNLLRQRMDLLTPADQVAARERGIAIRHDPTASYAPLWPGYVDRHELGQSLRLLAELGGRYEDLAVEHDTLEPPGGSAVQATAKRHRAYIDQVLKDGKGLTALERVQLQACLADIDAEVYELPDLLFVDPESGRAADQLQAGTAATELVDYQRTQLGKVLDGPGMPEGAATLFAPEVETVLNTRGGLARGDLPYGDATAWGNPDEQLVASLATRGVREPVRNQLRKHLDESCREAAMTGSTARGIDRKWQQVIQRAAARGADPEPGWADPGRRDDLADQLVDPEIGEDIAAQRLAADATQGQDPSTAATANPQRPQRKTPPGSGVTKLHDREKEQGL